MRVLIQTGKSSGYLADLVNPDIWVPLVEKGNPSPTCVRYRDSTMVPWKYRYGGEEGGFDSGVPLYYAKKILKKKPHRVFALPVKAILSQRLWKEWIHREVRDNRLDEGLAYYDPSIPVILIQYNGNAYLLDGLHRTYAASKAGSECIGAVILSEKESVEVGTHPGLDDPYRSGQSMYDHWLKFEGPVQVPKGIL